MFSLATVTAGVDVFTVVEATVQRRVAIGPNAACVAINWLFVRSMIE
jgi:hypothetical protein